MQLRPRVQRDMSGALRPTHCENTIDLWSGLFFFTSTIASIRASSLLELVNSAKSIRCRKLERPIFKAELPCCADGRRCRRDASTLGDSPDSSSLLSSSSPPAAASAKARESASIDIRSARCSSASSSSLSLSALLSCVLRLLAPLDR